eukprot:309365-Prorocentrum_lima.AAC.1
MGSERAPARSKRDVEAGHRSHGTQDLPDPHCPPATSSACRAVEHLHPRSCALPRPDTRNARGDGAQSGRLLEEAL